MDRRRLCALLASLALVACDSVERPPPPDNDGIYAFAQGCYALDATDPGSTDTRWLEVGEEETSFRFSARTAEEGSRFFLKPSDLGTYLFYDEQGGYLVSDDGPLLRQTELMSDIMLIDDSYVSGAEWMPETSSIDWSQYQLRNRRTGQLLGPTGLTADEASASAVTFVPAEGCMEHPELSLDATGEVSKTNFDNGEVSMTSEKRTTMVESSGAASRLVGAISSPSGGALSSSRMPRVAVPVHENDWPSCWDGDGLARGRSRGATAQSTLAYRRR